MGGIVLIGITWIFIDLIKKVGEPTISADNWKNVNNTWDVFDLDSKTFQKNLKNGKYK